MVEACGFLVTDVSEHKHLLCVSYDKLYKPSLQGFVAFDVRHVFDLAVGLPDFNCMTIIVVRKQNKGENNLKKIHKNETKTINAKQ